MGGLEHLEGELGRIEAILHAEHIEQPMDQGLPVDRNVLLELLAKNGVEESHRGPILEAVLVALVVEVLPQISHMGVCEIVKVAAPDGVSPLGGSRGWPSADRWSSRM